jgi:hypothetical protein
MEGAAQEDVDIEQQSNGCQGERKVVSDTAVRKCCSDSISVPHDETNASSSLSASSALHLRQQQSS